jgi:hypothetical protein
MLEDSFVNHINNALYYCREEMRGMNLAFQPEGDNGCGGDPERGSLPS